MLTCDEYITPASLDEAFDAMAAHCGRYRIVAGATDTLPWAREGRAGDVHIPWVDRTEALATASRHFIDCIRNGTPPVTGATAGLRVVQILEAAERSLGRQGEPVSLELVS